MAYNSQYDLRGKRIQDTYTQVVQYDTSSGVTYTGQGASLDNFSASFAATASRALTAAFANNATSASYAPSSPNVSASYASQADHATSAASLDDGAFGASASLYGPFLSGEVSIDGINTGYGLYLDQYSVLKASQMRHIDMDYASGLTSNVQEQLDNMRTGSGVDTASYAIKSETALGVQGPPNQTTTVTSVGAGRLSLWGNGMTVTSVSDFTLTNNGNINLSSSFSALNVTAPLGTIISGSGVSVQGGITSSGILFASGSNSWSMNGDDGALSVLSSNGGEWGFGFTGEMFSREGFIAYSPDAGGFLDIYIPKNTAAVWDNVGRLTSSLATDTEVGYLSGLTGNIQAQIDSIVVGSGSASASYLKVPGPSVLINDVDNPTGFYNTALGAYSLSSSILNESVAGENTAVGGYALGNLTLGDGNTAVGDYAAAETPNLVNSTAIGAYTVINNGLTNVTVIGAETIGEVSNTVILGTNADVGIGTSQPKARLHVSGTISASSFRTEYNGFDSGLTVGGIDVESNDNTNGFIGWNAIDVGGGKVKKTDGPSGVIEVSAPSMYFKMSVSDVSGSSAAGPTQVRIDGIGNNVSLGGSINTGFVPTGATLFVSGSGLVGINNITPTEALDITGNERVSGFVRAGQGFTGSLSASTITASCATVGQVWIDTYYVYGTASYANTASVAVTSSYTPITVQGNGSSLDQYIPFVQSSGSVDKLFVDNTNDLRYNPTDGLLTVTHISASCITGSAQSGYVAFLGTASWALNVVNGGPGGNAGTQSSVDISMKDMQFPFTAAFAGITPALLNGSSFDNNNFNRIGNGSVNGLVFWYLQFRNENIAGGNEAASGITASLAFHQMRVPVNYNPAGGVTHSFQYFAMGTTDGAYSPIEGEVPGANDKVYWNVDLYALTASTDPTSNFFSAPKLCGTNRVTKSFSGAIHESGSMETVTSMFYDAYLSTDCMFFINVKRINSDSSSIYDPGTPVGDRTDYTGSVAMVSSRITFNTM